MNKFTSVRLWYRIKGIIIKVFFIFLYFLKIKIAIPVNKNEKIEIVKNKIIHILISKESLLKTIFTNQFRCPLN